MEEGRTVDKDEKMTREDVVVLKELGMRPRRKGGSYELKKSSATLIATKNGELGVGLIGEDDELLYWGLVSPHAIVQFYRAMELLDELEVISNLSLSSCYYAGARKLNESGKSALDYLRQNGAPFIVDKRKRILKRPIPQFEIDAVLREADKAGVWISGWELEDSIRIGDIRKSSEVTMFIQKEEHMRSQRKIKEYLAKKLLPLADNVSFQSFCERVGLGNLCTPPAGMYGFDWGHYVMSDFDEEVLRMSIDGLPVYLFCTQYPENPDDLGAVGIPVFEVNDEKVIMERVEFDNQEGKMKVMLAPMSGVLGNVVSLDEFENKNPKFVGMARYTKGYGYNFTEASCVLPNDTPSTNKSMRQRFERMRNRLRL